MATRQRNLLGWASRWLLASLIAMLSVAASAASTTIVAFGTVIALPSTATEGTVIGRYFISPAQACGAATCQVNQIGYWMNGGSFVSQANIITTNVSGVSARLLLNGQVMNGGDVSLMTVSSIEVQLVRDARAMKAGSLMSTASPGYFTLCSTMPAGYGGTGSTGAGYKCRAGSTILGFDIGHFLTIELRGTITPIAGTCSTPDQIVSLPTVKQSAFNGTGSILGTTTFQISLNNCPAGFYRVGYSLTPVSGAVANFAGTLAPLPVSTASGVAIQLADQQNVPVTFDESIPIAAYNQATGGSFSVPLTASYIQTAQTVTVGSISAAAQVLVDYQ